MGRETAGDKTQGTPEVAQLEQGFFGGWCLTTWLIDNEKNCKKKKDFRSRGVHADGLSIFLNIFHIHSPAPIYF